MDCLVPTLKRLTEPSQLVIMPSSIMLSCIMLFLDRQNELTRLRRVADSEESGLVVVYGRRVLLGEVKWSARPFNQRSLEAALRELASRPAPPLPPRSSGAEIVRALFVPAVASRGGGPKRPDGAVLVTAMDLLER